MRCEQCGEIHVEGNAADFCANCGAALTLAAAQGAPVDGMVPEPVGELAYAPAGARPSRPYRSGRALAKAVTVLFYVMLGLYGVLALTSILIIALITSNAYPVDELHPVDVVDGCVGLLFFPVFIATVVVYLCWLYRVSSNLQALQVYNQQFSPGWAVGYWFIPFVNLVRPYQIVKEIFVESRPPDDANPADGLGTDILGWWWALWLISNISENITMRLGFLASTLDAVAVFNAVYLVVAALNVGAALLCIRIVRAITQRQEARMAALYDAQPPQALAAIGPASS